MKTKKVDKAEAGSLPLSPSDAARFLAQQLGETDDLWLYRLANWRRPGRKARIPVTDLDGNLWYWSGDLQKFVDDELSRRVVITAPGAGGGLQARAAATPRLDGTERAHVRVACAFDPAFLMVFALDAAAARKLAGQLTKSAALVDRATGAQA